MLRICVAWTATICLLPTMAVQAESPSPIPPAVITLSVGTGSKGTPLTISGSGFPAGEIVAIYIDAAGPYIGYPPPGPNADGLGNIRVTVTWPGKNYDPAGRVDPTLVGPHTVCGDTAWPGSTQKLPARACAQFVVVAAPTTPTPTATPSDSSYPIGAVLIAFAVLVVVVGGVVLLSRRSS